MKTDDKAVKKSLADSKTANAELLMMGRLSGIIANELNNWLTVISGHAASLADNLIPRTRAHKTARTVIDAAKHAEALSKRLMTISKTGVMDNTVEDEIVDLEALVKEATSLAKETFAENNITIAIKTVKSPAFAKVNQDQLLDCIMHLFFNASDAMPQGGSITVDILNKRYADMDYVAIRVADTGAGIPKHIIREIFTPFFTTKNNQSAIGLGLTVIRSTTHKWNGFIKVTSRLNKGSAFSVFLPRATPATAEQKNDTGSRGASEKTILAVDNNLEILSEIKNTLTNAGNKVHTSNNGRDAIAFFKKNAGKIDVAIIDMVMPETDGKIVLEEILRVEPTMRIIITSGFSKDYARGYLARGTWEFVQKPIDPTQLLHILRRVINQEPPARIKDTRED